MTEDKKKRFNQEQYDMLKRCSDVKDITEWNKWRADNPNKDILLDGADFSDANLQGANLDGANLEGAVFFRANLTRTFIRDANLRGINFKWAVLEEAMLRKAHLENAIFTGANLMGTNFYSTFLMGANFWNVVMNSRTSAICCKVNEETDFRNVSIDNIRIESGTKTLLKYNIRRMNWEEWYKEHRALQCSVKLFWSISNYGISTKRIIGQFFWWAIMFSVVYWIWPKCVMVNGVVGNFRSFLHTIYFSVVTMTTLGFGDIAANPASSLGQILLMLQVLLGYVFLGALVTRLAVLFTADGPAGEFTPMDEKTKKLLKEINEKKAK